MKARKISHKSVLHKTYHFLKLLSQLSPQTRKIVLKSLKGDKKIYKSLRELGVNYLKGNLNINKEHFKKIDIKFLKNITKPEKRTKNCTCSERAEILQQGSGFIGLLAPALISLATSLLSK